jgi:alkylation response protein AidB-like acyl-CoA dehydrogenase
LSEAGKSPELVELVGRARDIVTTVILPNAEAEDRDARWPEPAMRALAEAGLMGLHVPRELGGHEQALTGLLQIAETLAAGSPSTALCYAMHCVGTAVIAARATDHQRQAYLEPIARGEHLTTLAVSEPGTGLHFYVPQTRATRSGDEYVLDGTKGFITNGGHADSYVVSTVGVGESEAEGAFSCFLVDADRAGLEWQGPWNGFGMRSNSSRSLRLSSVRVPVPKLLGEEGDQLWYIFEVVTPYFLMAMAGTYVGLAGRALEIAREHLGSRRHAHTGELLGSDPVLAHRLGRMWTELERTRQLVHSAAARADAGDPEALHPLLACKLASAETAVWLVNEAMTLGGGTAYRANGELARLLRDARASHVMTPTTDLLATWLGRALLKLPLI